MTASFAERFSPATHPDGPDPGASGDDPVGLRPVPFAFFHDRMTTVPNAVTAVRTAGAIVIAGVALAWSAPWLLTIAYAVYWLGDMLDGLLARRLGQETRMGAVFDIISDRACTSILCVGVVTAYPDVTIVVIPFFLSFMVLDTVLSLAFLCWPLLSPNYFWRVDRATYRLNWSPPAKAVNTAGVILLAVAGLTWASLLLVCLIAGVKVWSALRIRHLLQHRDAVI